MPFSSDKARKKYFAEQNSYRTNAWHNSEKLKEDIMNERKKEDMMKMTPNEYREKFFAELREKNKKKKLNEIDKQDIMNDAKRDGLPKGDEKLLYLQDDGSVTREKYSYSCPECNNKIKTSDKRCSKCKNYLDWT